jgi:divalent metal cation (Fe/Co/Zn/Cd) transporter
MSEEGIKMTEEGTKIGEEGIRSVAEIENKIIVIDEARKGHANQHKENFNTLVITAVLFSVFVIAEIFAAFASNSLSLLGDAAAMSVDIFTVSLIFYYNRLRYDIFLINY